MDTTKRLERAEDELEAALFKIAKQRRELRVAYDNNRQRNLELDAMHYVWCDGGCVGGTHRWQDKPPTEEVVRLAVRNTLRLVSWWTNRLTKAQYNLERAEVYPNSGALMRSLIMEKHQARRTARKWKKLAKQYRNTYRCDSRRFLNS